jgi:hypothetical protein
MRGKYSAVPTKPVVVRYRGDESLPGADQPVATTAPCVSGGRRCNTQTIVQMISIGAAL